MNIIKILFVSLLVTATACSDDWVEVKNQNEQTTQDSYTTKEHAIAALTSCYDAVKWRSLFGLNYQYVFYALDDRILHENATFESFSFTSSDGYIGNGGFNASIYDGLYKIIFRTNLLLEKLQSSESMVSDIGNATNPSGFSLYKRIQAEARFLRALGNFYLVVHFNKPVFMGDEAFYDLEKIYSNSEQEVFWNSIIDDLEFAIENLPEKDQYSPNDLGRVTKGAALTLLGKSYLYQQNWTLAKKYLGDVIESNKYELSMPAEDGDSIDYVYAYMANFVAKDLVSAKKTYKAENNSESIYEIQNTSNGRNIWHEWFPGHGIDGGLLNAWFGLNGTRNVVVKANAMPIFGTASETSPLNKDARVYTSVFQTGDIIVSDNPTGTSLHNVPFAPTHLNPGISEGFGLKKYYHPIHFDNTYGVFNDPNNFRMMRYADVLLMYAEAEFHLNGGSDDALQKINLVRTRAGMPSLTSLTKEDIILERDLEMFGECHRFVDLVRWSLIKPEHGGPWLDPRTYLPAFEVGKHEYLPIPEQEIINMKGALKQNPNW